MASGKETVETDFGIRLLDQAKKLTDSTFRAVKSTRPFLYSHRSAPYWLRSGRRPKEEEITAVASEITNEDGAFLIRLDVSQFVPEEIEVTVFNHRLTVTCEHRDEETKRSTTREYCRSYVLPVGVNTNAISASTSDQGILTIRAPRFCASTRRSLTHDVPIVVSEDYAMLENSSTEKPVASTSRKRVIEIGI